MVDMRSSSNRLVHVCDVMLLAQPGGASKSNLGISVWNDGSRLRVQDCMRTRRFDSSFRGTPVVRTHETAISKRS
jgi:hypothetical protein